MIFVYLILVLAIVLLGMSIKQMQKNTEERLANLALQVAKLEGEPNEKISELINRVEQMEKTIDDIGAANNEVNDKFLKGIDGLFNYNVDDARGAIKQDA
ncbi:MAG: hypothetical protein V8T45_04060 [Oscillospiraceae bacterium]